MKKDTIKRVGRTLVCATIFFILIIAGHTQSLALTFSKEDYNKAIQKNNIEIEQCEVIKSQLHATAEEVRKQENYNEEFVNTLSAMWLSQDSHQKSLIEANEKLKEKVASLDAETFNKKFIGYFKITHYCNCSKCCGKWAGGATASGTMPKEGRTIATDPKVIPLGGKVKIGDNDIEYIAEDTGGAIKGNKIDVFVSDHSTALQLGVLHDVPVYLVS